MKDGEEQSKKRTIFSYSSCMSSDLEKSQLTRGLVSALLPIKLNFRDEMPPEIKCHLTFFITKF